MWPHGPVYLDNEGVVTWKWTLHISPVGYPSVIILILEAGNYKFTLPEIH